MTGSPESPTVTAAPERSLVDEPLDVDAAGFDPGTLVTLRARSRTRTAPDASPAAWEGRATFRADDDGRVDPAAQAPVDGDYDRVRPMGLFQFATRVDPGDLSPGETRLTAVGADGHRAAVAVERRRRAEGVAHRRIGEDSSAGIGSDSADPGDDPDGRVVGDLLLPPGDGVHPGVLLLDGPGGGRSLGPRADLLASRGYAVLALAYFGPDLAGVPDVPREVPLEYLDAAVDRLRSHDRVRDDRLGAVGHSRGAEAAVFLAARNDAVRTLVASAPAAHALDAVPRGLRRAARPPWTDDGDPVPSIAPRWGATDVLRAGLRRLLGRPLATADAYADGVAAASEDERAAAALPVEEVGGPVLLVSGDDDRTRPSRAAAERLVDRLDDADYPHPVEHLVCEDAGHSLGVPYLPVTDRRVARPAPGLALAPGGTPGGDAAAAADAWPRLLDHLRQGLRPETGPERIR